MHSTLNNHLTIIPVQADPLFCGFWIPPALHSQPLLLKASSIGLHYQARVPLDQCRDPVLFFPGTGGREGDTMTLCGSLQESGIIAGKSSLGNWEAGNSGHSGGGDWLVKDP